MRPTLLLALLCLFLPLPAAASEIVEAVIFTRTGEVPLRLEVAATPETRRAGLMHRTSLAPQDGMLFLFPEIGDHAFWMKHTPLPLDMLFLDRECSVVHIEADVAPHSLAQRRSGQPINAVIELDAGRAMQEGVAVGDKVRYELPEGMEIY